MPDINTGRTDADAAFAAAAHVAARARAAVSGHGRFCVALSGGRTPWKMLERLVELDLPWNGIHVFQVDERVAPDDDADRNATKLAAILGASGLPDVNLHLMPVTGEDPDRSCNAYSQTIARHTREGRLDLVHLGLGEDGHTASLVPGDPVLDLTGRDVAMAGPYQGRLRMTLTRPAIDRATERMWVVTGASKAEMLARLRAGDETIPAGRVTHRNSVVFADEAAANLPSTPRIDSQHERAPEPNGRTPRRSVSDHIDHQPGSDTMLKLGYKASAEQFGPRDLLEFSVHAEQAGFDSIMVSDHFQPWRHTGGHAPYSFAWLGALGERTSKAMIGTSVVTPTFRYHPSIVAQAMGTLGAMYPGRVMLGVGTGESLNEVPSIGCEWPAFRERFRRLKESIELMRKLWTEERVTYEGEYFRTENATIYDRPDTPIPLYVAASGAVASRLAGRVADGFICTSGKKPELYSETLLPAVREGMSKAVRAQGSVELMIEMKVSFDTDRHRAMEDTRHWAALALSPEEKMGVEDPTEMERLSDALPVERAASRWIVSTDVDEHIERIAPYVDLGFRHLVFHAPGTNQRRFIDLYAAKVMPALRQRFG